MRLADDQSAAAALAARPARSHRRPPQKRRVKHWDDHVEHLAQLASSPGFLSLRDRILELASVGPADRVLDVGAGTGLLTLAVAPRVRRVTALDVSDAMCARLRSELQAHSVRNAEVVRRTATDLQFDDASFDVVLSNYCFHHLTDHEKNLALAEIFRVLRPGGRLVFGDMMFRIGLAQPRDRLIILRLVLRMLRRGPTGLLRLMRNMLRVATGRVEHPAGLEWWDAALRAAGFAGVDVEGLAHEGGIAIARRPPSSL